MEYVSFLKSYCIFFSRKVSGEGGGRNYKALGIGGSVKVIAAEEGISSFWKGIGAAWLREASYTSLRLGLYDPIKKVMGVTPDSHFLLKFTAIVLMPHAETEQWGTPSRASGGSENAPPGGPHWVLAALRRRR